MRSAVVTELIAHRGASRERRENTLPAFERALELGADGIELDTHATSDGVVVVHHDHVPRAESDRTNLQGRRIAELTAADIATFRFPDGSHIPTLDEVVDLVGDRSILYVELKARTIESRVIACLKPTRARYALHSFDHGTVKRARAIAPAVQTGILTSSYLLDPVGALRSAGARDYWQSLEFVDSELVDRVHEAGARVIVWTVNGAADAEALRAAGVDGICSDDLRVVRPQESAAS